MGSSLCSSCEQAWPAGGTALARQSSSLSLPPSGWNPSLKTAPHWLNPENAQSGGETEAPCRASMHPAPRGPWSPELPVPPRQGWVEDLPSSPPSPALAHSEIPISHPQAHPPHCGPPQRSRLLSDRPRRPLCSDQDMPDRLPILPEGGLRLSGYTNVHSRWRGSGPQRLTLRCGIILGNWATAGSSHLPGIAPCPPRAARLRG